MAIKATLWDFGGVLSTSPFDAFATYERRHGLPDGFIRGLNATNADTNAWARQERNEVDFDRFCDLYEAEARAAGHRLDAREVMACLSGEIRPAMLEAVRRCHERLLTGLVTNNIASMSDGGDDPAGNMLAVVDGLFDVVIESSKLGIRKPDPRIYAMACEQLNVEPAEVVYLDDLGINLKPARAIGMTTIKVVEPDRAIAELEAVVGFPLS